MALYSWKAFSTYIRSSMHTGPVTYGSYITVFLESEASLWSTYRITRDFATRRELRSRLAMVCIVMTMVYVLAWPTLASAMTGYTSTSGAFVLDSENNFMSFASFTPVAYVIHDGWRVNLTGDYLVPYYQRTSSDGIGKAVEPYVFPCRSKSADQSKDEPLIRESGGINHIDACSATKAECSPARRVSNCGSRNQVRTQSKICMLTLSLGLDTQAYGFLGLNANGDINDIETKWMNQTIPKPALNISAFYVPPYNFYGHKWTDPRTNTTPYAISSNLTFMVPSGNETYNLTFIKQNGSCQALGVSLAI
jgi:hypothetical protein